MPQWPAWQAGCGAGVVGAALLLRRPRQSRRAGSWDVPRSAHCGQEAQRHRHSSGLSQPGHTRWASTPASVWMVGRTCDIEKGRVWCDGDKLDKNVTVVILVCCHDSRDWGSPACPAAGTRSCWSCQPGLTSATALYSSQYCVSYSRS